MKPKDPQSLGDVIKRMINYYPIKDKLINHKLYDVWERELGKSIAVKTQDLFLRKGKLFITLTSAPLRNELFYSKSKLIDVLNTALGEDVIKEIVFK